MRGELHVCGSEIAEGKQEGVKLCEAGDENGVTSGDLGGGVERLVCERGVRDGACGVPGAVPGSGEAFNGVADVAVPDARGAYWGL